MNLLSKFTAHNLYPRQLIASCIRVISIILAVTFVMLMVMSLDWPLISDAPIYHYIAWLISIGKGAQGGLHPFWGMMVHYLPIYADLSRQRWQNTLLLYDLFYIPFVFEGFIVLVVSILFFIRQENRDIRRGFLCLGIIYGLLHSLLQGRGWYYHLFPFLAILIFLAASWLHDKDMQRHPVVHTIMLLMLLHLSIGYGIVGIKNIVYPLNFGKFTGYFFGK